MLNLSDVIIASNLAGSDAAGLDNLVNCGRAVRRERSVSGLQI